MVIYKPRTEVWNRSFPQSPQKEPILPTSWFGTSSLQNHAMINFCCVSHLVWIICYNNPRKLVYHEILREKLMLPCSPGFHPVSPSISPATFQFKQCKPSGRRGVRARRLGLRRAFRLHEEDNFGKTKWSDERNWVHVDTLELLRPSVNSKTCPGSRILFMNK